MTGETLQHRATGGDPPNLGWVIDQLTTAAPGIAHVVVATSDGLAMAASSGLPADRAGQVASISCGTTSMAAAVATVAALGGVRQVVVEMADGYFIVMTISDGSCLAVLASKHLGGTPVDIGVIGHEMGRLVTRLGSELTPARRAELVGQR